MFPPGHVHLCMGAYGEHSSRLRNFEGFKLVTNLKEIKEAKCKIFYFYLSKKIRLDFSCESKDSLETSSLFSPKNNEKIFMNVVCCSRDLRFKG